MALPRTTPVIVDIGEAKNKAPSTANAIEPAGLMLEAIQRSIADASGSGDVQLSIDSISVVPPWTWVYPNLPLLLAEKLQVRPHHLAIGEHGGNQPALLCDEAARRISAGETKCAIITGGEALASLSACQKAGQTPPEGWTKPDPTVKPISLSDLSFLGQNVASRHFLGLPIHVYPLYENGLRAHTQQTQHENERESADLYAAFDRVACQHSYSWRFGETPRDASSIRTVTKKNRMICTPYPLLLNAFNTVDLAAACIMMSAEHAESLGVPQDKWIYVIGGADAHDKENFWERSNFYSSLSLEQSIDKATAESGLTKETIECYDIYSCFPVVPKLACKHLGLSATKPKKPITLLGGLTSFGGAGNNYSMHAIVEMTRQIRRGSYRNGLVLANGGCLTHHHAICLSSKPRQDLLSAQPSSIPLLQPRAPLVDEKVEGKASIETYTVEYDRQGRPRLGHIVGRLDGDGHRFVSNHGDDSTLEILVKKNLEPIGLSGFVSQGEDGRNLFYLKSNAKL
ncbi:hypothetical protein G7046_g1224 [Stylonectria norvegica]|nr:hypothetical protein G7046_g1224 [Stylonectria norvegica]